MNWVLYPYVIYVFGVLLLIGLNETGLLGESEVSISCGSFFLPLGGCFCVILNKLLRKYTKRIGEKLRLGFLMFFLALVFIVSLLKYICVSWWCVNQGSIDSERTEILERLSFLQHTIITSPEKLLNAMPASLGTQFQGEWALYSCSMLSASLVNISMCYPDTKEANLKQIDRLISMVMSPSMRRYDMIRWGEDPLESLDGNDSHVSYLSHLAWMITGYKKLGGNEKYDELLESLCSVMNRRLLASEGLNLQTYPDEAIYIPDMLVAIVALNEYANLTNGRFRSTVERWIARAKHEWCNHESGILVSFLQNDGSQYENAPVKGSYSALNCYYLTFIDEEFAKDQYEKIKARFWKDSFVSGLKEYDDRHCSFGFDVDAGPVILDLSPSGTAFFTGPATFFNDANIRMKILQTAEIAGHTIYWNGGRHYLLAKVALVGEAIMLAMRTHYKVN